MKVCVHEAFCVHDGLPDITLYITERYLELVIWQEIFTNYKLLTNHFLANNKFNTALKSDFQWLL